MTTTHKIIDYRDYSEAKVRAAMGEEKFQKWAVFMLSCEINRTIRAIQDKDYSHSRAGRNGADQLNGLTHIYHRDPKSPTGVTLAMTTESPIAEFLLRLFKNNSPLSPTER